MDDRQVQNGERDDGIFAVLGHAVRRAALHTLLQTSPPVTVGALADRLTSERGAGGSPPAMKDGETISLALHHQHLPKLAAANLISYDTDERVVTTVHTRRVYDALATVRRAIDDTGHSFHLEAN